MTPEKLAEFESLARPLMKFLCENFHPHVTAIITPPSVPRPKPASGLILRHSRTFGGAHWGRLRPTMNARFTSPNNFSTGIADSSPRLGGFPVPGTENKTR